MWDPVEDQSSESRWNDRVVWCLLLLPLACGVSRWAQALAGLVHLVCYHRSLVQLGSLGQAALGLSNRSTRFTVIFHIYPLFLVSRWLWWFFDLGVSLLSWEQGNSFLLQWLSESFCRGGKNFSCTLLGSVPGAWKLN